MSEKLEESSIEQYRKEERSLLAKRMINTKGRYKELIRCMINDHVSSKDNVKQLRNELYAFSKDMKFKRASTMGQILRTALDFVKRNYENVNTQRMLE